MEFRLGVPGATGVENVSDGKESGEYVRIIIVENGVVIECTCPVDKYQHHHAIEAIPRSTSSMRITSLRSIIADRLPASSTSTSLSAGSKTDPNATESLLRVSS